MAKGQEFTRYQQGIVNRYYEHKDTIMTNKLGEVVSELYVCTDPKKAERLWTSARTALGNLHAYESRINTICAARDVKALAELVNGLVLKGSSAPATKPPATPAPTPAAAGAASPQSQPAPSGAPAAAPGAAPGAIPPETLKSALKAFRKRMKLTRLDDESQIGSRRNPLSGGSQSQIVAIQPPSQFPREVWDELVKQGKLINEGRGFYKLAPGA